MLYEYHSSKTGNHCIGIVVRNDTNKEISLDFLTNEVKHKRGIPMGVTVSSLEDDVLFDDGDLLQLKQHIAAVGKIHVSNTRIMCAHGLQRKGFQFKDIDRHYRSHQFFYNLEDHISNTQFQSNIVDIQEAYSIGVGSQLTITNLLPYENVNIYLFNRSVSHNASFTAYKDELYKLHSTYSDGDARKRLLLI